MRRMRQLAQTAALVLLVTVAAPMVVAVPTIPGPWPVLDMTVSSIGTAEGVTCECLYLLNVSAGKGVRNCSTAYGWYAEAVDGDSHTVAMIYAIEGAPVCYTATDPSINASPVQWFTLNYTGPSKFGGKLVNRFIGRFGRYTPAVFTDAVTNEPMLFGQAYADNVHELVSHFSTRNVQAHDPRFQWPTACSQPPPEGDGEWLNRLNDEVVGNDPWLLSMFGGADGIRAFKARRELAFLKTKQRALSAASSDLPQPFAQHVARVSRMKAADLPAELNNAIYANPVRNQGRCGCCWAFSTTALTEVVVNYAAKSRQNANAQHWLSPQSKIDCVHGTMGGKALIASKGCFGGWPLAALNHTVSHGIATEVSYPFDWVTGERCRLSDAGVEVVFPLSSATQLPAGEQSMQAAILEYGAVVVGISALLDFAYYGGNYVYNNPSCPPGLAHAVLVVGWGTAAGPSNTTTPYWLVKNSFGAAWGEAGYIRMARGVNMCGIEDWVFAAAPNPAFVERQRRNTL